MIRDSRKIAAILAADIVDYSRLMGADEAATLAALKACGEETVTFESTIGSSVKYTAQIGTTTAEDPIIID